MLRRAMGRKKPRKWQSKRQISWMVQKTRGIEENIAGPISLLMEKFAEYGFNQINHSAAYALVAYQTAWLKAHYPAANVYAAVMSADMRQYR